jgi:PEP-CTERM motif
LKYCLRSIFLAVTALATTQAVNAANISGVVWSVPGSTANNVPTLGNTPGPGATEWGTFTASAIDFSGDTNYSLGGFLNSFGAASNITYMNGASASSDLTDVLFEFTGTDQFTNGQNFTVFHDDGVNLYVNGALVLGAPNTTSPVNTPFTYNGPTGAEGFDFIYANGPATMADFQTTLVSTGTVTGSPEPSSLFLLAIGILALFSFRKQVMKRSLGEPGRKNDEVMFQKQKDRVDPIWLRCCRGRFNPSCD